MTRTASYARAGWAIGWAREDGPVPLPDRGRHACTAACEAAEQIEHPDLIPLIIETAAAEARSAKLHARRLALYAAWQSHIGALFQTIRRHLDLDAIMADLVALPADRRRRHAYDMLTRALLMTEGASVAWHQALKDAFTAAGALGAAEALASVGGAVPTVAAVDALVPDAVAAVVSNDAWAAASAWIEEQLNALAGDLLRAVGGGQRPAEDMVASATAAMDEGRGAVFVFGDELHGAFAQGFAGHYVAGQWVNFVTMGDDHVCEACLAAEAGNPYLIDNLPDIPNHDACRCAPEAAGSDPEEIQ